MPGYKGVVPVEPLGPELQCSQCSFLLREALQTEEGDRMCRSCFEEKKQKGIWWSLNLSCSPDDAVDEKIQLLRVYCTNSAQGCSWEGKLKDLKEHCDGCPKSEHSPNGYGEVPSSVINYVTNPYVTVSCKHCSKTIPANELQDHVSGCEYQPQLSSSKGCGEYVRLALQSLKAYQVAYYDLQKQTAFLPRDGSRGSLLFKERPALKSGIYSYSGSFLSGLPGQLLHSCTTLESSTMLGPRSGSPHFEDGCYSMWVPNSQEITGISGKKSKKELRCAASGAITTQPRAGIPKSYSLPLPQQQSQASVGKVDLSGYTRGHSVLSKVLDIFTQLRELSVDQWAFEVRNVRDRMKTLESRMEQLEKENQSLKSSLLEQTPHVVTGVENVGEPCITKSIYQQCIDVIYEWIDVKAMLPQLMKHHIVNTQDDIHAVTHGLPGEKIDYLYSKLCGCKNGFQLLYRCLRESQSNQLGHKDAADKLEEIARKFGPGHGRQCSP